MSFDGRGNLQKLLVLKTESGKLEVSIIENIEFKVEKDYKVHIAIGPTKKMDRMEWFVEKCIEIGVDEISFLDCRHSIRHKVKEDRMGKIILSAARQSGNFNLPIWNPMVKFEKLVASSQANQKFIAYVDKDNPMAFDNVKKDKGEYLILIGPEGDFSQEEIQLALKSNFMALSLGPSRLRTETAGIVACNLLNFILR